MSTIRTLAITAAAAAAACGGPASAPDGTAGAQAAAQSYQAVGQGMAVSLGQYQASAGSMVDLPACHGAEVVYEGQMGPMIDRMLVLSGDMDRYLGGAMSAGAADMDCVAWAMKAEYEGHRAIACTGSDVPVDRDEAQHHSAVMAGFVEHQRVRYEQMGETMGITPSTGDTTWTCVHHPDGTFTMDGHYWTPSGPPSPTAPPDPTPTPTPAPTPQPWPWPCGGMWCPCGG